MNQAGEGISCDIVYSMGITGKRIGVAVLNTGVHLHEDFKDRVTAFANYVNQKPQPYDDNGHGIHISAMVEESDASSEGKYREVAPGCSLMFARVLDHKGNGYASDVLVGLKWIRGHMQEYGTRIVNISAGSLSRRDMTESPILVRGVNAAWDDGLVAIVAASNHGPSRMTITTPGISCKVIVVGCSDDRKEVKVMGSWMADYSGHGPTLACICKLDTVAPGSGTVSCCNEPDRYFSKLGTNVSTPLVSGAIALLLERYLEMSNRGVRLHIRERIVNLGFPYNQQGWGESDMTRLLEDQTSNRLIKVKNA